MYENIFFKYFPLKYFKMRAIFNFEVLHIKNFLWYIFISASYYEFIYLKGNYYLLLHNIYIYIYEYRTFYI